MCSYCVKRNYVCEFSTKVDATSVNIDNYQSSATSEVRSLSGIQECFSSAIVQQEQQQQIPISSHYFPGAPEEIQNLELKRKREIPDPPANQRSKKRRAETYKGQESPLQTSLAQKYINETPTSTQNSRPKQLFDDAAGNKLEVIIEKLTQMSNEQKEMQTQISRISAWEDLRDKISG
ncbi:uncharacterized protein PpBr36_11291 [Pyricularia pennisetigena]|uniref:uncharacterized protein n=1 Tax=Pyricularia pennisetigena TaxID=1578925 RepID=UPI0011524B57|nr:uncharacterized protein PpBr36_11291 [Pyricularia pennisetigena]TLS20579.1 hypothetical protein PpBr36_11291 [Pyricularia pennisetigena]